MFTEAFNFDNYFVWKKIVRKKSNIFGGNRVSLYTNFITKRINMKRILVSLLGYIIKIFYYLRLLYQQKALKSNYRNVKSKKLNLFESNFLALAGKTSSKNSPQLILWQTTLIHYVIRLQISAVSFIKAVHYQETYRPNAMKSASDFTYNYHRPSLKTYRLRVSYHLR